MEKTPMKKFTTVEEYLASFPDKKRKLLEEFRKIVKKAAPEAEEVISYNMPALKFHGILLYYAGHTNHIGFYPASSKVIEIFNDEIKGLATSKGTIQFQFENELPADLVKKIVAFRLQQNLEKAAAKKKKTSK
jgi:uncharacterized protein YdhG (YjbR/CyaY superfamily)